MAGGGGPSPRRRWATLHPRERESIYVKALEEVACPRQLSSRHYLVFQ